jgi:hypothetical protein
MLEFPADGRATATQLFQCYDVISSVHGWPRLSQAKFGRLAGPALQSCGVEKVKANIVVYNGVRIPESMRVADASKQRPPDMLGMQLRPMANTHAGQVARTILHEQPKVTIKGQSAQSRQVVGCPRSPCSALFDVAVARLSEARQ